MPQTTDINHRIVLASRPTGAPTPDNFRLEEVPIPTPGEGEVLLRTAFLSLDPYMRGRMSDAPSYAPPVNVEAIMVGATVSRVVTSRHPDYAEGEWVLAYSGWQDYAISDGTGLIALGKAPAHPSYALGILGMPGFTAYMGLLDIGQPKAGETLVVAAATGPVGATVGQIGNLKGCRVVGVAGGTEKCRYAVDVQGFDACIDHHADDFAEQLGNACPQGIDVYFENVGGQVLDAVLPLLNTRARIPVCGLIAYYNATSLPDGPDRIPVLMSTILIKHFATDVLKDCRVVGVAGSTEKCRYAVDVQGFDACIDHHADDFAEQLGNACPQGIDVYFENVGGQVLDAVLPLLNTRARIPVCGLIAYYNATSLPDGPNRIPVLMSTILIKRLTVKGFIIFEDYGDRYNEFAKDMTAWLGDGQIQYREQIVDGLENAPSAFMGLLEGKNFGKLVIRIGPDD